MGDDADEEFETDVHPVRALVPETGGGFVLRVSKGPNEGLALMLDASAPGRQLIGQGPAANLKLTDPTVSRRHIAVDVDAGGLRVVDLGSTNGTWLDGVRIVEAYARPRSTLRIGDTELTISARRATATTLSDRTAFGGFAGGSLEIRRLFPLFEKLAAADVPTLIEGETGTGKEILAEALHSEGVRSAGPFVVFDCTAVAPSLLEAELFGYEKGAFTGATSTRQGFVEQAQGGTLLIDEIGDLAPELQPKLLRLIDRGEIRRLGGSGVFRVDVRILAATRRNLDDEVVAGRFRDDLFHRLAVGRVELPPLRTRAGDVPLLIRTFCEALGFDARSIPRDVFARWETHAWPGNVRELRAAVTRYVALGEVRPEARPSSLPPRAESATGFFEEVLAAGLSLPESRRWLNDEFERRYVAHALERSGGNISKAAEASGIARRNLQLILARRRGQAG